MGPHHVQSGPGTAFRSTPQSQRLRTSAASRSARLLRVCHAARTPSARSTAGPTDGELVTLALNGGQRAFARLMERHGKHLRRLLAPRLRNPNDLHDIVQDTHLAIWRALGHYDARRPFEAWLTTIALNKYRDWLRHRRAHAGLLERLERELVAQPGTLDPHGIERSLIDCERVQALAQALERLPAKMRDPLLLTALGELPQERVARRLGVTRKAVELRIRRGRQRLEAALREPVDLR
ncbi:MAG TPA: RNA polymerase sigma factor [Steroidobacteraceae bacterium]|nr:RNA polymerase sigma factor [Steroidobacteraceae bacterium]